MEKTSLHFNIWECFYHGVQRSSFKVNQHFSRLKSVSPSCNVLHFLEDSQICILSLIGYQRVDTGEHTPIFSQAMDRIKLEKMYVTLVRILH